MEVRVGAMLRNTFVRYLFALATVAGTFVLRLWLIPFTGTGAPFVLFFAAVLLTSLLAGVGPGVVAIVISVPLAAHTFVTAAGYPLFQAIVQGLLFAIDGLIVVYLTFLVKKDRQAVQHANQQLRSANDETTRSMVRTREIIELAPDAFFQADLDARFTDVNQAACRLLGYEREELIGKTIFDIIPAEDADRLRAVKANLLQPNQVNTAEWTHTRKDGTLVPVEVSSNILPDGRWQAFVRDVSERKRVEQTLHESEERFRLTIDEAPIGMALVALDGRFVRVNRALCDIVGYTSAELTGLTFQAITHPDDLDADVALADQLARGDIPRYQLRKRSIRKNGTLVDILLSASLLRGRDGAPQYYIAQVEDITERIRAEEALRASEREFRELAESMPQIVWATSTDGLNIYFNQQWVDYTGLTLEESYGEGWITPFHPDDRQRAWDSWRRAVQHRDTYSLECRLRRADGVYQWWLIRGVPQLGANGEIRKWFGTCTDIEQMKHIEQERQFLAEANVALSSSLDYEQTLGTVAQLVVRDFADWCIVDITEDHETLRRLKVASRDPANAAICARLEQVRIDRHRPYLTRPAIQERRSLLIEHVSAEFLESVAQSPEHLQALRSLSPTSIMAVPLLMRGQLLGAIGMISSTPSRVYRADDLRLAEALADRAAVAIENARLYRSSVHAIELRDEVLRVVAHDLRNPLSALLLNAAALRRRGPDPERRSQKRRDAIHRAATRMNRLIQDLLDVAVMESGQLTIERARVSTRELIAAVVDMQRPLASASSLDLRLDVDRDLPDIWGDRDRLLQVLENLIGNAIKFTQAGGCITVGAASRDHEIIFRVTDTGAGIAAENLPHVFDRFWQATRADRQGAGLGLPITKGIVEAHDGRIWVESALDRGTTFSFAIPEATPEQGRPSGPSGSSLLDGYRAA